MVCYKARMCNLYSHRARREAISQYFHVSGNRMAVVDPLPAIFPGHMAPIVRRTEDGDRELVLRSWGFVLLRQGYAPKRVTNTRDDKLDTPFWRDSFEKRRCLVPATSFCEPDTGKPANWHWFALKDGADDRPLFAFAGVYRTWKGPIKKDGQNVDIEVFSFMTTLPNELTASINHERSPVLLTTPEEHEAWLTGSPAEARAMIKTSDPTKMAIVQSGLEKRDLAAVEAAA